MKFPWNKNNLNNISNGVIPTNGVTPSEKTPLVEEKRSYGDAEAPPLPTTPADGSNGVVVQNHHKGSYKDVEPSWSEVMDMLTPYLRPIDSKHMACAVGALVSMMVGKIIDILPPLAIRYAVDEISAFDDSGMTDYPFRPILYAILAYSGLKVLSMLNTACQDMAQRTVALDAERRFSVAVFAHLHTLSLSYHLEKHIGEITRIMNRGSDSISTVISSFLFYLAPTFFEAIVVSAVFWKLGTPAVALTTISAVLVYLVFTIVVTKTRIAFRRKLIEASDAVGQKETETLVNYETVSMFGRTRHEVQQYSDLRQDYKEKRVEMLGLFSILEAGQKFIKLCGMAAGLVVAGMATVYGYGPDGEKLSPGSFVVIQMYIEQLFQPLTALGWQCK